MELKLLRLLAWVQLICLFCLIVNHMFRCLNWIPLCFLFFPAIAMVVCIEKEIDDRRYYK